MARLDTFTFRINQNERHMIEKLAANLQRSRSDSVRLLIREAVTQLNTAVSEPSREVQHANSK